MNRPNLQKIIKQDPSLIWYTKNTDDLSDKSILEHVLNYGTWEQVQESINTLGFQKTKNLYKSMISGSRGNLKKRVKHYFDLYFFQTHASRNTN